jgi:uncharacterized protein (TIGR03089 family)
VRPATNLLERVRRDGASPFVTFYDDATGERIELSGVTTLNWVAKLTHLLVDELWLEPGFTMGIDLPLHWQTIVLTLAAWSAGGVPTVGTATGDVVATTPPAPGAPAPADPAEHVLACSLRPLGARVSGPLPVGWLDFALAVPGHPDSFDPVLPAADLPEPTVVVPGARILATTWDTGLCVLTPLAAQGSVVIVRHPRSGAGELAALAASERVTHTLGCDVAGLPRL